MFLIKIILPLIISANIFASPFDWLEDNVQSVYDSFSRFAVASPRNQSEVVLEATSMKVISESHSDEIFPAGHFAKLMTLLLTAECIEEGDISIEDIAVYIVNPVSGEECRKANCKIADNVVTISEDFNDMQYVYIADKKDAKMESSLFNMFYTGIHEEEQATEAFGLVTGFPLLSSLGLSEMNIYYNDTGNPDLNLSVVSKMVAAVNYQTAPSTDKHIGFEDDSIQVLPLSDLKSKYSWLQNIFPQFESNGDLYNQSFKDYCLFSY